jgi:hypothetical protein
MDLNLSLDFLSNSALSTKFLDSIAKSNIKNGPVLFLIKYSIPVERLSVL